MCGDRRDHAEGETAVTVSGTMDALALEGFDKPPSLVSVPAPEPGAGEVLVRVTASSINAYDAFVAMGAMKEYITYEFPVVLGMDVAGVVESLGGGAEGVSVGDRVFGTMGMKGSVHDGSFGEWATPLASSLAIAPDGLDDQAAGTLGVAGTTAMSAVEAVAPGDGSTVLVVGATGGVGTFAIQLAAGRGAHVIATARAGDEDFVTALGAAETVDYTGDLTSAVRDRYPDGLDGLIDLVNRDPAAFASLSGLVRDGGHATSVVGAAGESTETGGVAVSNTGGNPGHLAALARTVVDGTLRVAIRQTYPLAEAAQALDDFTNRHTLGKLVITMG